MLENHATQGASAGVQGKIPSTDLVTLVKLLTKAIPKQTGTSTSEYGLLYLANNKGRDRLWVNTYGVLRRLRNDKDFQEAFKNRDNSGFLRDIEVSKWFFNAKLGGKYFNSHLPGALSKQVKALRDAVDAELDTLDPARLQNLIIGDAQAALMPLWSETKLPDLAKPFNSKIVGIEFDKSEAKKQNKQVARLISATEEVQNDEKWVVRLAKSIGTVIERDDDEFDETEKLKLIAAFEEDYEKPNSQLNRFLNFLEDEALSRVRLRVTFAIMDGMAKQATQNTPENGKFKTYVHSVLALFDEFVAPEAPQTLSVNMGALYGTGFDFSLTDEMMKSMFYDCLPVWAEWNTQISETRTGYQGYVKRNVSYRFRVNGKDPKNENKTSFESRLERIERTLDPSFVHSMSQRKRRLAELVFLWLVFNPKPEKDVIQLANRLSEKLKSARYSDLQALIGQLKGWHDEVKETSKALVAILKKTDKAVLLTQRETKDIYVVVQKNIVEWGAITNGGKIQNPLKTGDSNIHENVFWFRNIKITTQLDKVPANLFSIKVETKINDKTLSAKADNDGSPALTLVRETPEQLLNIIWRPFTVTEKPDGQNDVDKQCGFNFGANGDDWKIWEMGPGIDIWYDARCLSFYGEEDKKRSVSVDIYREEGVNDDDRKQFRAATTAAMMIIVYMVLQRISQRLMRQTEKPLSALMMRFQSKGKAAQQWEGDSFIYAISQAVESALMQDMPVRMQGLTNENSHTMPHKIKGSAFALASNFPIVISEPKPPVIDKIALITYATRPCDYYPESQDADGYLYKAKTYFAEAVNTPFTGYRMSFDKMQSFVVNNRDALKQPTLIHEEIAELEKKGFKHIVLISSHYGNHRINSTAARHSPHAQIEFLNQIAEKFPEVNLYTMRRDVFPATRLHDRSEEESAFETSSLSDHNELIKGLEGLNIDHQSLTPSFTLATLSVVGKDTASRPQSGFCTYFWQDNSKIDDQEWRERVRSCIISNSEERNCISHVLRGLHYLETEKTPFKGTINPVLDPFSWMQPATQESAGEITILPDTRRRSGSVTLSLPALLFHVSDVLHSEQGAQ
jgi:hypothetical protein